METRVTTNHKSLNIAYRLKKEKKREEHVERMPEPNPRATPSI
jgi:hypothetical protein